MILLNPAIYIDNYLNVKPKPKSDSKNLQSRNTAGYDFDDKEIEKLRIWYNGHIPYYIDELSYDKVFRDKIRNFLEEVNNLGNVQFFELRSPPLDNKTRFVMFLNRGEDSTALDYSPLYFTTVGAQRVRLNYDCFTNGDIHAAILAVVGVPPQHDAPNRDKYIEVKMDNVLDDKRPAFQLLQNDQWLFHDLDYDFNSAGHFDSFKFTKNGKATVVPKVQDVSLIKQNKKQLSVLDIYKIRRIYNFISRYSIKLRQSDCKKMYKPGPGLLEYKPKGDILKGTALKKPNKYLGLPDDNISKSEDENLGQNVENTENSKVPDDNNSEQDANNSNVGKIEPNGDSQDDTKEEDEV